MKQEFFRESKKKFYVMFHIIMNSANEFIQEILIEAKSRTDDSKYNSYRQYWTNFVF